MWILATLVLLAVLGIAIFFAWYFTSRKSGGKFKDYFKDLGFNENALAYEVLYPSLGIKIQSNFAVKVPISVYSWTLDYSNPNTVKVNAKGFWSAVWQIEIDLQKAGFLELECGKFEIHEYLVKNGIMQFNSNLY